MYGQDPGAPARPGVPEDGRIPEYYAVKVDIAALLAELGEGEVLPTEREPAARFEVSRETLGQARRELVLGAAAAGGARHGRRRAQGPRPASTSWWRRSSG